MRPLLLALLLIVPVTLLAGGSDGIQAGKKTKHVAKTSIVDQANQEDVQAEEFQITAASAPFTFQKVKKLRKIKEIRITLSLEDADTGQGDSFENNLTLGLDGIDTGLHLNGFRDSVDDTRTISGKPDNAADLLAALKDDGAWQATIIDADPSPSNEVTGSSGDQATLVLKAKQKKTTN